MLLTTDKKLPHIALRLKARVGLPLQIEPAVLDLGAISKSSLPKPQITIRNSSTQPVRLLYATSSDPTAIALVPREPIPPGGAMSVALSLGDAPPGPHSASVQIHTDCQQQRFLHVQVRYAIPVR
jgi:hypothetical protein